MSTDTLTYIAGPITGNVTEVSHIHHIFSCTWLEIALRGDNHIHMIDTCAPMRGRGSGEERGGEREGGEVWGRERRRMGGDGEREVSI